MPERPSVLFLCTGNSCRSQMAEAWTRKLHPAPIDATSAGVDPGPGIDPRAVRVMHEAGVDMSGQHPKHVRELAAEPFDLVVTVCNHAHETCPVLPGAKRVLHRGFDDPPRLAASAKSEDEALEHYRRVRDEIRAWVETLLELLGEPGSDPESR